MFYMGNIKWIIVPHEEQKVELSSLMGHKIFVL